MSNSLTYRDLPDEINCWPGLPLSLSGNEVMPLDYRAGDTGWVLYGNVLDKNLLSRYQRRLGVAMVIVSAWNVGDYQVVRLAGTLTPKATKLAHEMDMDVAPMSNTPTLRSPGLLVMDMDSTAIQIECIDEIAKLAGTGDLVAEVTERAMRGELDFSASLRQRVGTLKGADANILRKVRKNLPLMPGLTNMVAQLQEAGWHVAIASGGFTYFADHLKDKLGLVAAVANEMGMRDGKLTGEVVGPIVDAKYKVATLRKLAEKLDIPMEQTVAIGDGANDLLMIKSSGLGIAYHAKPKVNEQSAVTIRHADLNGVLCILSGSMRHEKR
ncbi:phosphoserine phosphatase SerB [Brenneria goodwinii]|uniref:Phosphoserine phosphatase n=1 Tax=Brenneria goodwinii TaxID=1109412 RepID=A0A0G4JSF4_9GAMM|nr:phosphoserine phosphatase [Brenneria goodwinii]ATA25501.1 phosphoserine phosphatase [Brenneria goodwinii]MCG8156426.1 phosphoserine phosphatase [Brenneria goodwinii]MCG8163299.1 phosphoserine phosphatase [Brenneria goodwinii]MCG8167719.1 phosphoserine phosphatase [Brenneria goodwinii]MCG8172256.1 phosphoserine phosphatase [Brenneria goodwinii]